MLQAIVGAVFKFLSERQPNSFNSFSESSNNSHGLGESGSRSGESSGDLVRVFSAGSQPKNEINPIAVEVMKEVGIDISTRTPKILDDQVIKLCDYVITMGCGDACPVYPGKIYLDWDLADPAGKSLEEVRTIRDDIKDRVISLICEISLG